MSALAPPSSSVSKPESDPIRVMVVDDAIVARGLMTRWLDSDPRMAVIASHRNGKMAVNDVERVNPDVIVLDIEMPEMDGLTALPLLLKKQPHAAIIMASTLTRRNAEISLKALSLGASDYVPKPETNSEVSTSVDFRRDLIDKVASLGARAKKRRTPLARQETGATKALQKPATALTPSAKALASPARQFTFQPFHPLIPKALFIGASTGGPQALQTVLRELAPALGKIPAFITQHMPPTFTQILAENLTKVAGRTVKEGVHGELVAAGIIYIAPGNFHMRLAREENNVVIKLDQQPPVHYCRPSVDPLFESGAVVYGSAIAAAILTGMGSDGIGGIAAIAKAGGNIIAQDEASCVVFGMPQAAAATGLCVGLYPLNAIAVSLKALLNGVKP